MPRRFVLYAAYGRALHRGRGGPPSRDALVEVEVVERELLARIAR